MEAVSMLEMLDIYDELGQKTEEAATRDEVHRKGLVHKAVCVWIINSHNEILFQKRSSQVMFSDLLDISFSGHVKSGETSFEAVLREGKEELGIEINQDNIYYLFSCREYGKLDEYIENEIEDVYLYRADIPTEQYQFCDHEVQSVMYIPLDEFKSMLQNKNEVFVPYELHYCFLVDALESNLCIR